MFQTEGDGWDQFAFPFLTVYFWVHVYLNTYTNGPVDPSPTSPGRSEPSHSSLSLWGFSVRLCVEAEPVGLGLGHVVTLGRAAVTCFSVASGLAFV